MTDTPDPDAALAEILARPQPGVEDGELVTLEELAEQADVPVSVLEAIEREGLLVPQAAAEGDQPARYAADDAALVRDGMRLLEAGLPLGELLELARRADDALREVADHAVDLFARFVRDPVRGRAASDEDAAEELVGAFRTMLPATETLVSHHLRRLVIARARQRLGTRSAGDVGGGAPAGSPAAQEGEAPES